MRVSDANTIFIQECLSLGTRQVQVVTIEQLTTNGNCLYQKASLATTVKENHPLSIKYTHLSFCFKFNAKQTFVWLLFQCESTHFRCQPLTHCPPFSRTMVFHQSMFMHDFSVHPLVCVFKSLDTVSVFLIGFFLLSNSSHSHNLIECLLFFTSYDSIIFPFWDLHSCALPLACLFCQFFLADFILIKEEHVLNLKDVSLRGLNFFRIWCCTFSTYAP